jgi:hypothetical protein
MPESTTDQSVVERSVQAKQEWHAPRLTVLGDMRTLTETGGAVSPDGPATSAIS